MILLLSVASASSLDIVEVGGAWGTPNATDGTSLWWNPASMASGHGTRFNLQAAPTIARVDIARSDPGYAYSPDLTGPNASYGGNATFKRTAVVPFLGVVSDFGQPGLGVGAALMVPHGRGAGGPQDNVVNHTLVEGGSQTIYFTAGGAYEIADVFSFGLTGAYVSSSYESNIYSPTGVSLNDGIMADQDLANPVYNDSVLEDPNYMAYSQTQGALRDSALTFGLGARVEPHEMVSISLAYRHGFRLDHTGNSQITFDCPPNEDTVGRFAAETSGLCHSVLNARQTVGYDIPSRVHAGLQVRPTEAASFEVFGGWSNWKQYTDLDITVDVDPNSVPKDDPAIREETAGRVSSTKQWARDARNSFFVSLDTKFDVHERVLIGARVLYDKAAVPTHMVSANNYDANTVALTALVAVDVTRNLQLGASIGQYVASRRTVEESAFGMTMNPSQRQEARYFYHSARGAYASTLTRLGFSLRGQFDHGKSRPE